MKKIIIVCAVVAFATSCKKDYSCECTTVSTSGGVTETTVTTLSAKTKKKDAEAWCTAFQSSKATFDGTALTSDPMTCKIK